MINRLYIKNHLSFKEVELKFDKGLSVFTGVSGAGKSVLMNAILAVFGLGESGASLIEADVEFKFDMSEYGIESEEINNFRMVKEKTTRYFINSQFISKKNLQTIADSHIKYLSVREINEFENERLIALFDQLVFKNDKKHILNLRKLNETYTEFSRVKKELEKIEKEERSLEELKEFAKFEIDKIESINPKRGEFEELMELKKRLSKLDKINEAWSKADAIFEIESAVMEALNISDIESAFFDDAMNELRAKKESLNMEDLESIDIEATLDRIEALSGLDRRYGSIEEALKTLEVRKKELASYENREFEKSELKKKFSKLSLELEEASNLVSSSRKSVKKSFENMMNLYLKELFMRDIEVLFLEKEIDSLGGDKIEFVISDTNLKNLSSGELNRLRLAFIATTIDIVGFANGVLILDEIDANLSGKEAMSIADVLLKVSKHYQIFAISHLPQLSSRADSHFLITKENDISTVKKLSEDEKITELARMISGENISEEALNFAEKLKNS
ncbi:MAG: AAA family ATPase [Campylobacteraceae bacterium]|nr:AAA family ATPase [Campylobacteraceae bacterium]